MKEKFEKLYEKFYNQVYNYVFYRVLNKNIAEDIVSDVFLKVMSKYESYDKSKSAESTWIFAIAKNTLIDYYRGNKSSFVSEKDVEQELPDNKDQIKTNDQRDEILFILKRLTPLDRTVISLKYFSDMTYRQISDHIGYSPKHVGVVLSRALKKFKKIHEELSNLK